MAVDLFRVGGFLACRFPAKVRRRGDIVETAGGDAHIGDFSGRPAGTVENMTVLDEGSADTGADRNGKEGRHIPTGAEPPFPQGGAVGIIFDDTGKVKFLFQDAFPVRPGIAGDGQGVVDTSSFCIDDAGCREADAF